MKTKMEPPGLKPGVPTGGIPSGQVLSAPSKGAVLWSQGKKPDIKKIRQKNVPLSVQKQDAVIRRLEIKGVEGGF